MKLTFRFLGLFALCAAAFVSCQREAALDEILQEESLTRTTYSSTGSIVWNTDDQLRVRQVCYTGTTNNLSAHAQLRASNAPVPYEGKYYVQASFDAVSPAPYVGHESYKFQYQAFYPAARAEKSGTKVNLTLPAVQKPRANTFDPSADLVVSDQVYSKSQRTDGLKVYGLTFSRLSSIGVLTIKGLGSNVDVQTIEITAGNKPMAGTYAIDINNAKTLNNTSNTITLNMVNGKPSNSNNFKVYFTCLPATYTKVQVKVKTNQYERVFKPADLGFDIAKPEELVGGATEIEAKEIFDRVLANTALPAQKNIVLANAAFGIQVLERGGKSIDECIEIARESIDSGRALQTFKKFVELNS